MNLKRKKRIKTGSTEAEIANQSLTSSNWEIAHATSSSSDAEYYYDEDE